MRVVAVTILLAALCAGVGHVTANHAPATARDGEAGPRTLEDTVMKLLEKFRQAMKSPNSGLGLPRLDPLQLANLSLNLAVAQSRIALELPRLEVEGLSTFVVEQLKVSLLIVNDLILKANFGFSIADIVARGAYSVDGRLLDLLSLFGAGDFRLEAVNFNVTGGLLQIGYLNDSLYVNNLTLDFNLDQLKIQLQGLFGGGDVGDLANRILNDVALGLVLDRKQDIISYATGLLVAKANAFLRGKSLDDLGSLINGGGGATSPAAPAATG